MTNRNTTSKSLVLPNNNSQFLANQFRELLNISQVNKKSVIFQNSDQNSIYSKPIANINKKRLNEQGTVGFHQANQIMSLNIRSNISKNNQPLLFYKKNDKAIQQTNRILIE